MATVIDYIKWRGDLEFWQDGFNKFDNLIFSAISYVEMDEIFADSDMDELSLEYITKEYFAPGAKVRKFRDNSVLKETPEILRLAAATKRFKKVLVRNYVSLIDLEKTLQFAAMEFLLPDGTSYIAYRGTDDNIVGWKEDFMLAVAETEAEREAVAYINEVADGKRKLRLGGHSKGGHLAVYAAAFGNKSIQDNILEIYSNDGPGFTADVVRSKSVKAIAGKVVRIIPEDSVVGLLMEPVGKTTVVKSTNKAMGQHDLLSWCLDGMEFETIKTVSKFAEVLDNAVTDWLNNFEEDKRVDFVNDLFSVLEASGAETLSDISDGGIKAIQKMTKRLNSLSPDTKEKIGDIMKCLFKEMTL